MGIGKYEWGDTRFDTLVDNGDPKNRLDIAILGDGYARDEMALFEQDVDAVVASFHDVEPMKSYIKHFNFHRVNVISQQSGIDDRWQKPRFKAKSALGAHFSFMANRRLVGWDWRVWQVAKRAGVPFDSLLVIVNTPRRGGATRFWMTVGYASRNSSDFPRIMIHEAGHSVAKLMDEYTGEVPDFKFLDQKSIPNFLPFANVSTSAKNPPWKAWIAEDTVCPTPLTDDTPLGFVGAIQGASYTECGAYRPTRDCFMKRHSQPFCPVCSEQWIKRIYRRSTIADGGLPEGDFSAEINTPTTFNATVLKPEQIKTIWRVRDPLGIWTKGQETADFAPFQTQFDAHGQWTVECSLEDHSSKLRKPNVIRSTRQTLRWMVRVG